MAPHGGARVACGTRSCSYARPYAAGVQQNPMPPLHSANFSLPSASRARCWQTLPPFPRANPPPPSLSPALPSNSDTRAPSAQRRVADRRCAAGAPPLWRGRAFAAAAAVGPPPTPAAPTAGWSAAWRPRRPRLQQCGGGGGRGGGALPPPLRSATCALRRKLCLRQLGWTDAPGFVWRRGFRCRVRRRRRRVMEARILRCAGASGSAACCLWLCVFGVWSVFYKIHAMYIL